MYAGFRATYSRGALPVPSGRNVDRLSRSARREDAKVHTGWIATGGDIFSCTRLVERLTGSIQRINQRCHLSDLTSFINRNLAQELHGSLSNACGPLARLHAGAGLGSPNLKLPEFIEDGRRTVHPRSRSFDEE